jgi:hypothetical protein
MRCRLPTVTSSSSFKPIWVFDNQDKANPVSISTFPAPSDRDYLKVGGHFGPHNVHEHCPGSCSHARLPTMI